MECLVCGAVTTPFNRALILRKFEVEYYRCSFCGFIQTEPPYWLEEAYSSAIASSDTGIMRRNLQNARITVSVISALFPKANSFLDYGAGHGTFVRLMRDRGFDFRWYDKYAVNQYARGFEHTDGERYDLVTAFEILEHLTDPIGEIAGLLQLSDNLLTTTLLLPDPAPAPADWWYYGVTTGQHVSFYTRSSLEAAASRLGVHVQSNGSFHLWTRTPRSKFAFHLATNDRIACLTSRLGWRQSLTDSDYELLSGSALSCSDGPRI